MLVSNRTQLGPKINPTFSPIEGPVPLLFVKVVAYSLCGVMWVSTPAEITLFTFVDSSRGWTDWGIGSALGRGDDPYAK